MIAKALIKAQKNMVNPKKESENPFFKSRYADLNSVREAVIPALNEQGIVVLQPTINIEGKNFVRTILLHESGEKIEGDTEILFTKQNDPQAQGSGISYARRYGLQSLVCVGADDDDGNEAASTKQPTKEKGWLNKMKGNDMTAEWQNVVKAINEGTVKDINTVESHYKLSAETKKEIELLLKNATNAVPA